ncbi:MAG: hypothetical protein ABL949_07740 [Fimbriimonadaceae bacterium]
MTKSGAPLKGRSYGPGDLTLVFDSSGSRAFPAAYQALLQDVFTAAKPTMDIIFGQAASAGPVLVKNYDADIGDRDAVAGGAFLPNNGSGQPEIRFPVYVSPEATAVNFIHTLLLAYIGPNNFTYDAFQEGIVRATLMKVVRTPGSLPAALDAGLVDSVLQNTYDVGNFYDWYNQSALANPAFIAPNLKNEPLPAGGSLGGIYLLRYQMAGSAWQKLIAQNSGFVKEFLTRYYANPTIRGDIPALIALGQTALDAAAGTTGATVEGTGFAGWAARQFILDTNLSVGPKLLVQPIPITSGLAGTDYGVFDVSATYFTTLLNGNETLLSGTAYPIFWDQTYNRVFPGSQDDRMDIAGAYGSVTPNIPDINGGQQYRCTIDIPVGDRIARAYVPVGSIATTANPTENNCYGTITGLTITTGQVVQVRVSSGTAVLGTFTARNGAFGGLISSTLYTGYSRLKVEVLKASVVQMTRFVNKGPGALALDLRIGEAPVSIPLLKGIQLASFPTAPNATNLSAVLGRNPNQVLAATYDAAIADYLRYPDFSAVSRGQGVFLRNEAASSLAVDGQNVSVPVAISLKPGWNLIGNPLNETVPTTKVQIVRTTESPKTFAEASSIDIDPSIFSFVRGANDAASGAPESGSYAIVTSLEPGKGYFVRCLAPEGLTLIMFPSTSIFKPGTPRPATGWRIGASVTDGRETTQAMLGKTPTATGNFGHEDSLMPPRFVGGLSASFEANNQDLAVDLKHQGSGESFTLKVVGLKVGTWYSLKLNAIRGGERTFQVRNALEFFSKVLRTPGVFRFKADAEHMKFAISEVRP